MKKSDQISVVFVTAPDLKTARALAKAALESRKAACANLIPRIESHYWWQGKLQCSAEVLIIFKTTKSSLGELEKIILHHHPYDTPEFVVFPLTAGSQNYLDWVKSSVAEPA